ncbi:WW domain-containing oxidoreductase [Gryllus bimaculatus]|nr:WW domain-containing oxidoreductase [Gryllus bimaculatus]
MGLMSGKCSSTARLDGKTAVVTGCNTGIGLCTVEDFVRRGERKAERAAECVRVRTVGADGAGAVRVVQLDLSSLASVRACAKLLLDSEPRIHLLINNAAGDIDFENLNWEKGYNPTLAYGRSKLANVLFAKELGKRLEGSGVTSYSLHPGVVNTELSRHFDTAYFKGGQWIFDNIGKLFLKTPEQGAQTTIYCAVSEEAEKETGLYYSDCRVVQPRPQACDMQVSERLWNESARLVGLGDWDPFTAKETPDHLFSSCSKVSS